MLRENADCCAAAILLAPISGETMPANASGVCEDRNQSSFRACARRRIPD